MEPGRNERRILIAFVLVWILYGLLQLAMKALSGPGNFSSYLL